MVRPSLRSVVRVVAIAAIYVLTARAGLQLGAVDRFATLVWAPSGIALAALLLLGTSVWPAVALGALIANLLTGATLVGAIGIALGNTLEAVAGSLALRRLPGFRTSLDRDRDVLALIVFAAGLSTTLAATVGVVSLALTGGVAPAAFGDTWLAWWLGDAVGILLVAPPILAWKGARWCLTPWRVAEAALVSAAVVATSLLVFDRPAGSHPFAMPYLIFPPLVWAALRFGIRGAVSANLATSAIAIWATVAGRGPFVHPTLSASLLSLQSFTGLISSTFLVLGSAISEQRDAERALEENVREVSDAHAKVDAANRAKSDILAVVSHELRTPLNAIGGFVELLREGSDDPLTERQRDALERVSRNVVHIVALIEDVVRFAKLEAGNLTYRLEPVPIDEVFSSLDALVSLDVKRRKIQLTCDGDRTLVAHADPEKVRQVVFNVVANAVKFTPEGGRVDATAERCDAGVRIVVTDTGPGIPAEQLSRVFEPFYQVQGGNTRRHPGIGLGLSIARDLTRGMGGTIRLESTVGRGTRAIIELPAATS